MPFAYLEFDLKYCGYNVPTIVPQPSSMVLKSVKFIDRKIKKRFQRDEEEGPVSLLSRRTIVASYRTACVLILADAEKELRSLLSEKRTGAVLLLHLFHREDSSAKASELGKFLPNRL